MRSKIKALKLFQPSAEQAGSMSAKIEADRAGRAIGVRVPNLSCKRRYRHLATAAVVSDADYILPPDLGRHAGMRRIDATARELYRRSGGV